MHRVDVDVERLTWSLRREPMRHRAPAGLNEATWIATSRLMRVAAMRASVLGVPERMKHTWVLSVTALAGRRRCG